MVKPLGASNRESFSVKSCRFLKRLESSEVSKYFQFSSFDFNVRFLILDSPK